MRRYYLLKGYTLVVGVGLLVLGLVGFVPALPLGPSPPHNLLHLGVGSLFVVAGFVFSSLRELRVFVGGMGAMLVLGKVILVLALWTDLGLHMPLVGIVCLIAGVGSMLAAALVGIGTPPED